MAGAFLLGSMPMPAQFQGNPYNSGCSKPPYTSCTDAVPGTYLSGSWIQDNSASEWTITADNGSPGVAGQVTGTVLVFPPPLAWGCPVVHYQVAAPGSSYYTPSGITFGVEGSTTFQWEAINPNPSGTCNGYTPVTTMTFNGTIPNKGNDTGGGTWKSTPAGSGALSIETNLVLTPTGEGLSLFTGYNPNGWGTGNLQTQLEFFQTLQDTNSYDPPDPYGDKFQGRQVYEAPNGAPVDGCFSAAVKAGLQSRNPTPAFAILGSVWNVGWNGSGEGNVYGLDSIGWTAASVSWYQTYLPTAAFPCQAVVPQAMVIINDISGFSNEQYSAHTLTVTLTKTTVTVQKDSVQKTVVY